MAANALSASTGAGFPSVPAAENPPIPAATRPRFLKISLRLVLPRSPLLCPPLLVLVIVVVGMVGGSPGGKLSAGIVVVARSARADAVGGIHRAPPVVGETGGDIKVLFR